VVFMTSRRPVEHARTPWASLLRHAANIACATPPSPV
jgi:hypothetical protein